MSSLLVILIGTVLVNTFLLMQRDEGLGGSRQSGSVANAIRIGGASSVVLFLATGIAHLLWRFFTVLPLDTLLFVYAVVVVVVAVALDQFARSGFPRLSRSLAVSPLLAVSNSLALGTGLLTTIGNDLLQTLVASFALGVFFCAAMAIFVALMSRHTAREIPAAFRLAPIALVSAGLLTLALMGFTGLLRG